MRDDVRVASAGAFHDPGGAAAVRRARQIDLIAPLPRT